MGIPVVGNVATNQGTGADVDVSITIQAGSDRALFAFAMLHDAAGGVTQVNSVTLDPGGSPQSLTHVATQSHIWSTDRQARVECWQLVNPPTGTFTVRFTFSQSGPNYPKICAAVEMTGVHQTTPTGATNGSSLNSEPGQVTLTTANDNSLALAGLAVSTLNVTYTPITDVTELWDLHNNSGQAARRITAWGGSRNAATAGDHDIGVTSTTVNNAAILAVEVREAVDAPAPIEESASLARSLDIATAHEAEFSNAETLTRAAGLDLADLLEMEHQATLSLLRGLAISEEVQGAGQEIEEAITLARSAGLSAAALLEVDDSVTLAYTLSITQPAGTPAIEETVSLSRLAGLSVDFEDELNAQIILDRAAGLTTTENLEADGAATLAAALGLSALGETDSEIEESVTLSRTAGLTQTTEADLQGAVALGRLAGIAPSAIGEFGETTTLGVLRGLIAEPDTEAIEETVTLSRSLGVASLHDFQAEGSIVLGLFLSDALAVNSELSDALSLGRTAVLANETNAEVHNGFSLARSAGLTTFVGREHELAPADRRKTIARDARVKTVGPGDRTIRIERDA
jgi:hypothetical protein